MSRHRRTIQKPPQLRSRFRSDLDRGLEAIFREEERGCVKGLDVGILYNSGVRRRCEARTALHPFTEQNGMELMDQPLRQACHLALTENLGVQAGESVLVVTDAQMRNLAEFFNLAARAITRRVKTIEIPVPPYNGSEPPQEAAVQMKEVDVVLLLASRSLSWTRARLEASAQGARIASMPAITREIILRTFPADYRAIRQRVNRVCDLLDGGAEIKISSPQGTDLTLSIRGREGRGRKGGIYTEKGAWGNLPCGEAFIAPVEGSAYGTYVVDASQAGVGKIIDPIRIRVENGLATLLEGGEEARILREVLEDVRDPNAYNLAEVGIGCHDRARITGMTLEDEKVMGTCHIALGRNSLFGGAVDVGIHLDGILREPTLRIDDCQVLEKGRWVLGSNGM